MKLLLPQSAIAAIRLLISCVGLSSILWLSSVQAADESHAQSSDTVKLIELFTSHGCSSCPPADRLLGELLEKDESLLALEFHVDYWNSLVHGNDGNFVDPYSKPEYSMRQREYNAARLSGRPGVYTPQAVVNGVSAVVGSKRRHIMKALKNSKPASLSVTLQSDPNDHGLLRVGVTGEPKQLQDLQGTDISVIRFIDSAETLITGGENNDLRLTNHHIVYEIVLLGQVSSSSEMSYNIEAPKDGEGCVVLVQTGASTPVFAAVECP